MDIEFALKPSEWILRLLLNPVIQFKSRQGKAMTLKANNPGNFQIKLLLQKAQTKIVHFIEDRECP